MATLPSPTQIAGQHSAIYEAYYNVVDPKGFGSIGGMEAARFLKRSGLSDVILSKIWDLSDPGGRGCLDKTGMFVALKLVALVQNGKDLSVNNIPLDLPPPKMGDIPLPKPQKPPPPSSTPLITSLPPTAVDWSIKPTEKEKYEKLFDSLQPMNGLIAGNKVKSVLMESKLPFDTLGKIWDLADQDKDGMLDRYEFIAAMHLVYKALDKFAIPNSLPVELMPPAKRKGSASPAPPILNRVVDGIKPDITSSLISQNLISSTPLKPVTPPIQPSIPWVVTNDEKAKSDALFIKSDVDKDGFVSGQEIKDVFLQSGVPQPLLAHIWGLCDIKQSGKLNNEQFALAMWLVARCLKGIDLPPALTPEMIPPSFRSLKPDGLVENNNTKYSNPELEMISKDIEQLSKERLGLETEITQKEADIRIKRSEITSLQSELDTLAATLKQLENQKGEAQKRLNDLKAQSSKHEVLIAKILDEMQDVEVSVDKLRAQAAEQSTTLSLQESELNKKKQQLEGLKQEEERLEKELTESTQNMEKLAATMQESQLNISQAKALKTQLEEQTRQLTDAIESYDAAITSGDASNVGDTTLRINPDFREAKNSNLHLLSATGDIDNPLEQILSENLQSQNINPFLMPDYSYFDSLNVNMWSHTSFGNSQDDPFEEKRRTSGFDVDPFHNDPFKNTNAFSAGDAFSATFGATIQDGFSSDPFENSTKTSDPFDAFGDSRKNSDATSLPQEVDKDPFGCDPFAILHAPTRDGSTHPRPTSPSPALPPKKSKQPPPRPAPPRPQPPKKITSNDPFGSDTFGSSGGFADFSDFDSKLSNKTSSSNTITGQVAAAKPSKGLEFVDDPFRDYRYEDPFNISFEEEEQIANSNKSESVDAFNMPKNTNSTAKNDCKNSTEFETNDFGLDKFDPFGLDGRQSVPLPSVDLFAEKNGRASVPINSKVPSEDQQLAWAATESLRLEKERQQRLMQEEADLKLAISLSKAETKKD